MYPEVITKKSQQLLKTLKRLGITKSFYLAGGTALALQYGHRRSGGFDFFSKKDFSLENLKRKLFQVGRVRILAEEEGTLTVVLADVRLSFFRYPYRLLFPLIRYEGIFLADLRDIACMKIKAIAGRGGKKDFIDLYFLLKNYKLPKLLELFDRKYQEGEYSRFHLLKSLTYFEDANKEPMPRMTRGVSWKMVKDELKSQMKSYI